MPSTCGEWQEGLSDQEVSIFVQEVTGVELLGDLLTLKVIEHRGQIGPADGALWRGASVAQGASAGPPLSPDVGLK